VAGVKSRPRFGVWGTTLLSRNESERGLLHSKRFAKKMMWCDLHLNHYATKFNVFTGGNKKICLKVAITANSLID
jgi:hypothetical protein